MIPENQDNGQQEPQNCVIAWANTKSPGRGKGKRKMSRREANKLCRELNRDYPHINHWVEEV